MINGQPAQEEPANMNESNPPNISFRLHIVGGESAVTPEVVSVQLVDDDKGSETIHDTDSLWRYINLAKLIELLSNRDLWLSRMDLLVDPFEGSTLPHHFKKAAFSKEHDPESIGAVYRAMRRWILISCWHLSSCESDAMWRLYGLNKDGIALKTSVGKLRKLLEMTSKNSGANQLDGIPTNYFIGPVSYIDYQNTKVVDDPDWVYRYFLKREAFAHEREYRIITPNPRLFSEEGISDAEMPKFKGTGIPIDPESLLDEIVISPLAPSWFLDIVKKTVVAFGAEVFVRQSTINDNALF